MSDCIGYIPAPAPPSINYFQFVRNLVRNNICLASIGNCSRITMVLDIEKTLSELDLLEKIALTAGK